MLTMGSTEAMSRSLFSVIVCCAWDQGVGKTSHFEKVLKMKVKLMHTLYREYIKVSTVQCPWANIYPNY